MRLRASAIFFLGALCLSGRATAQTDAAPSTPAEAQTPSTDSNAPSPAQGTGATPAENGATPAPTTNVIVLDDGRRLEGTLAEQIAGAYLIVVVDGRAEAIAWEHVTTIDGVPRPPVPPAGAGTLIPPNFQPSDVKTLGEDGRKASENVANLFAPRDGKTFVESIQSSQGVLEAVGLKRGPPSGAAVGFAMVAMPLCFFLNYGNLNGPHANYLGPYCTYFLIPMSAVALVAAPFIGEDTSELDGPSFAQVDLSVYALDYEKKSALTGTLQRQPESGVIGSNLGYDAGLTLVTPKIGFLQYAHTTLQQTLVSESEFMRVSNNFFKADAQLGWDFAALLGGGDKQSWWTQQSIYVRGGGSFFHDWINSRDTGSKSDVRYTIDNPLNRSVALMTAWGYEVAAEADIRFPFSLGGLHFKFERGTYPILSFPSLDARDAAFVALIGFDDLREGETYTWQRMKLELELPIGYSRHGGFFVGGQLASLENNYGSGVDNRGVSLDYRFRF